MRRAVLTFFVGNIYKRYMLDLKDRADGIRWARARYPKAKNISVVFY